MEEESKSDYFFMWMPRGKRKTQRVRGLLR
jgi:hypothetical protein